MKKKTPYAPVGVTQMLLHLQAEWAGAKGPRKAMLCAIHRMVGSAHGLAKVLEEIIADAPPDLYEKASKELRFYKETIGDVMKFKSAEVEETFVREEWENFARETFQWDGVNAPRSLCHAFSVAMEDVYKEQGTIESVLWSGANPSGTEDRTWVRVYAHLKGIRHYEDILTGFDRAHACRIREAFKSVGVT